MITRRSLFGISAGAAATAAVPTAHGPQAETYFKELVIGVDFGKEGIAMLSQPFPEQLLWDMDFGKETMTLIINRMGRRLAKLRPLTRESRTLST